VVRARSLADEMAGYDQRLERIQSEALELEVKNRDGLAELDAASADLMALRNTVSQLESRLTEARIKAIEHDSRSRSSSRYRPRPRAMFRGREDDRILRRKHKAGRGDDSQFGNWQGRT